MEDRADELAGVVKTTIPFWVFRPGHGRWIWLGIITVCAVWIMSSPWQFMIVLGVFALGVIVWRLVIAGVAFRSREHAAERLAAMGGRSWGALAQRAWLAQRVRRRDSDGIDPREWFAGNQPAGPRPGVIYVDVLPFEVAGGDDWPEPAEVGGGRRRTAENRRSVLRRFVVWTAFWIMFLLMASIFLTVPWPTLALYGLIIAIFMLVALYEFGHRPIELGSDIASPGRLDRTRFGKTTTFTREDSVLVVEPVFNELEQQLSARPTLPPRRPEVIATLVRRDGRRARLVYDGPHDAGLWDLLLRWTAPGAPAAETAGNPLKSEISA